MSVGAVPEMAAETLEGRLAAAVGQPDLFARMVGQAIETAVVQGRQTAEEAAGDAVAAAAAAQQPR